MKPSRLASLLAPVPLALALGGCPYVYLDLYEPAEGAGAVAGTGGADGSGGAGGVGGAGGAGGGCVPASIAPCYDGPPGTEGHGL